MYWTVGIQTKERVYADGTPYVMYCTVGIQTTQRVYADGTLPVGIQTTQ
jgi:trans-2-enoyl-CoA reductase